MPLLRALIMRRLVVFCVFAFCLVVARQAAADVFVHGYYRSNGTYVQPYHRSSPDSTVTNNYSFRGNINPSTGKPGTNYYRHDLTSPYYTGPDSHGHVGHANGGVNALPYAVYLGAPGHRDPASSSLCPPPY